MSTEVGIWRIGAGKLVPISLKGLEYERHLQNIVADDVSVIGPRLTVIGREVGTPVGSRIDILAIDSDGNLTIVELKRDRTPREVVAQILDYGSWIRRLTAEDIGSIYIDYQARFLNQPTPSGIDDALIAKFGSAPEELNSSHQLIIVAAEIDPATERIVSYLQEEYGVNISVYGWTKGTHSRAIPLLVIRHNASGTESVTCRSEKEDHVVAGVMQSSLASSAREAVSFTCKR